MKLSFSEYDKIRKMSHNELSRYLVEVCKGAYKQGVEDGEKELDGASAEQWLNYINQTPSAHDIFTITDGDTLEKAFRNVLKDRIALIIGRMQGFNKTQRDLIEVFLRETFSPDMLWESLSIADKIKKG